MNLILSSSSRSGALTFLILALIPAAGTAQVFTSLYSFPVTNPNPPAGVIVGPGGVLYGTTYGGGGPLGTVYQLQPPSATGGVWTQSVIYTFSGPDGSGPDAPVTLSQDGILYGTTKYGGKWNKGTVFQLAPPLNPGGPWTETVLHSFSASPDGSEPVAGVVIGASGVLYGTTAFGGFGAGTVFALAPPASGGGAWRMTVIHSFTGAPDGAKPLAGVALGKNGTLYGTTYGGGASGNFGIVFALVPSGDRDWVENVIHCFTGSDGAVPYGGVAVGPGGGVYGTTSGDIAGYPLNDGTVFELLPPSVAGDPWTENVLYRFSGPDGERPECSVLHSFDGTDGADPLGGVVSASGSLFGATIAGGTVSGYGAVSSSFPEPAIVTLSQR